MLGISSRRSVLIIVLRLLSWLIGAGVVAFHVPVHAETKTILAEAVYTMDDGETPASAEAMVLHKAKQLAVKEAAASVETWIKAKHADVTMEDLQTITASALHVDVLEKHRLLADQALQFSIKVQGVLHSDQVKELAERLKGKSYTSQHKKIREDYAAVFREMDQLKASKAGDPTTYDSEIVRDRIREQEKAFARIQQQEVAFYERLLKGKELHAKAEQQLAEQRNRPQKQSVTLNGIFEDILHHGHEIRIGEPDVKARLEEKGQADLYFPLSLTGNAAVRGRVKEAFASLGGEISNATYRKVEQRLANIWFVLEVTLADGSSRVCYVPTHLSKFQTDGEFISMEDGQSRWKIRIAMPIPAIKEIASVRGRFMESMPGAACGVSRG